MKEGHISKSCCYQSVKLFAHCININLGQAEIIWEYDGNGEIIVEHDCGHWRVMGVMMMLLTT